MLSAFGYYVFKDQTDAEPARARFANDGVTAAPLATLGALVATSTARRRAPQATAGA